MGGIAKPDPVDPAAFRKNSPGRLVSISDGGFAFIPSLLPVEASILTPTVVLALADAEAELGRLDGLAGSLPDPQLLIAPFLKREAVLSSRIEGTQTTYSDLVLFEAAEEELASGSAREVSNYVEALKYGVRRVADVAISRGLIMEMHRMLMTGTRVPDEHIGRMRDHQVYIAPRDMPISQARYVPPPAHELDPLLNNLVTYLQASEQLPTLIRLAIAHYQFEAIHPFFDGNGRLGRLLIVLMLCHSRRITDPMLYISPYFERNRAQYYDLMLDVSRSGEWGAWIRFFLEGIRSQARDTILRTRELIALRERYRKKLSGARRSTSTLTLVDALFRLPVLTNKLAAGALNFSWQAANENVQRLVDAGIVTKVDARGRKQYFIAKGIIDVLDRVEGSRTEAGPEVVTQET